METDEPTIRRLVSTHGADSLAASILALLRERVTITIAMSDGSEIFLANHEKAAGVLRDRFGWHAPNAHG